MAQKQVTLTITERFKALEIINNFKGTITQLSLILDDTKKLAISPEDWEAAKLVKTDITNEDGVKTGEQLNWEDLEGQEKTIDIEQETVTYLTDEIKRLSDANEITMQDVGLVSLNRKLLS